MMDSVSISITKSRLSTPIDLELVALPGTSELIVSKVGSLWESSNLEVGMHVAGANFMPFTNLTPAQAIYKLQHTVGMVTLQVNGRCLHLQKQSQDQQVGLSLYNVLGWCRISHSEALCHTLPSGWRLTCIITTDHCLVNPEALQAARFLRDAVGPIALTAIPIDGLVTTTIVKPTQDTKIGVRLKLYDDEALHLDDPSQYIYIRKITPGGLLDQAASGSSSIHKHKLVSINGITTFETVDQANQLIKDSNDRVILETLPRHWGLTAQQLAEDPPILQPGQVLATLLKDTSKVGFQLTRVFNNRHGGSRLVISHVNRKLAMSWLATSKEPPTIGMHLVSVNSTLIHSTMTLEDAGQLLREARGIVHIVASPIIASIETPITRNATAAIPNMTLGLRLAQHKVGVVVGEVHENGRLVSSELQAGQKIISINDQPCPPMATEAVKRLKASPWQTKIVALDVVPEMIPEWPQDCIVMATVVKQDTDTFVGLGLQRSIQGRIVISEVSETGLFAQSALQIGLVLLSINGVACPPTYVAAMEKIQQAKGKVTLIAAKSQEYAVKRSRDKLGITLGNTFRGIVIAALDPQGLFQWGVLKTGQRILRINGMACPDNLSDAVALLKGAPVGNTLRIEAVDTLPLQYEWPTECLVQVTATKTNVCQYVGLRVASSQNASRIVILEVDGVFGKFRGQLLPGMVLVSINGKECPKTCDQVLDVLQSFPADQPLMICAAKTVTYLHRTSPDEKWGLTLNINSKGSIVVEDIDPSGILGKMPRCMLKVGQRLLEMNEESCPDTVEQAAAILQKASNKIVLTTVDTFYHPWSVKEELVVTVHKESRNTRVGLGIMKSAQGRVAVSTVDGLFSSSGVQAGYVVVAINGRTCPPTAKDAMITIQQTVGDLVIVFAKTIAFAKKNDIDDPWGIILGRSQKHGIVVQSMEQESLFATTGLMVRQKVLTINGRPCPQNVNEVASLLFKAGPRLTIEAIDSVYPLWSPECLQKVTVLKPPTKTFVGLDIALSKQGRVAIARVDDKGLLAAAKLQEGQVLVSVNNQPIDSPQEAHQILHRREESLILAVAETVERVKKDRPDQKIGLSFELDSSDGVVIQRIDSSGLFGSSRLLVGQKIISINGMLPSSVPEAVSILNQAECSIEIKARDAMNVPTWPREGLATALMNKSSIDTKLGIGFSKSAQGRLVISSLSDDSPLGKAGLQVGQVVLSINEDLVPESPDKAAKAVQECVGEVSIIATNIVATATKATKDQSVGVAIGKTAKGLVISDVDPYGMFASTFLQKGQLIREINGKPCPARVSEAASILRESVGLIKLVVVDSLPYKFDWPNECLTTIRALKDYPGKFVGLELQKSSQGRIAVVRIDEKGIFARKGLIPGHVVVSINGVECPVTAEDSIQLLNESPKYVTLIVGKSVARAIKGTSIGLRLGVTSTHDIVIEEIDSNGPFYKTPLLARQTIRTINGLPCPSTVDETTALLESSMKNVTIEAMDFVHSERPSEELFTAVVKKTPERRYCGIDIIQSLQGRICIGRIDEMGLFGTSGLVPGHIILFINGIRCPENVKKAMDLLSWPDEGDVGIVVATTIARVEMNASNTLLGLSIGWNRTQGVILHSIDSLGLFGSTSLREQQTVLTINRRPCPTEVKAAVLMLQETKGSLEIVAVDGVKPQWPSECIVTTFAQKASTDDYVGLEFQTISRYETTRLVVSRIDQLGIFASSPELMIGQTLVSINETCLPSTPQEALSALRGAPIGQLTLLTAKTIATVNKSTENTELGISLCLQNSEPTFSTILVSKISKRSSFEPTLLKEGQKIVRINEQPCPLSLADTVATLKRAIGSLTIEAVDRVPSISGLVSVAVRKPTIDSKLGIGFRRSIQGRVVISKISTSGLLAKEAFIVGQEIISINGEPCPACSRDAVDIISSAKNVVTIEAASTIVQVPKTHSRKLGLSLGKNSNGVVVYKIKADGAFASSTLQIGQKVISINGQLCPSEVQEAIRLIKEAKEYVELEAVDVLYHWSDEDKKKMGKQLKTAIVTAVAEKESADVKVGLLLKTVKGQVQLAAVDPNGMFGGTCLRSEQRLIGINGEPCPISAKDAAEKVMMSTGTLTLKATE